MKKGLIFLISIFLSNTVFSQSTPLFTQHYNNGVVNNPAISGSNINSPLTIQTRQQWLGFERAPITTNISYHKSLNNRSAMGGVLMYDKAYPLIQANLQLNYAYHVPLDYDKINLSFGIGANLVYYNLDFNIEDLPPTNDIALVSSSYDKTLGDASAGVYLYGENFNCGFSAINLLQPEFKKAISESPYSNLQYRSYYGTISYKFKIINNEWELQPSLIIRKMQFSESISDFSTRIVYLKRIWFSSGYRSDGNGLFAFGFLNNNMSISYSYDHTLSGDIADYSFGSHELVITFNLTPNKNPFSYSSY